MQTVKIENCTDHKNDFFKIIVNGEKYVINHEFLTVSVADDKPLNIKAKYFWYNSPIYTFDANENISIQILMNQRLKKWNWLGPFLGAFFCAIAANLPKHGLIYSLGIILLFLVISIIIAKKAYIVKMSS